MPSFYHGSVRLYLRELAVRLGKDTRNGWKKLTSSRGPEKIDKRKLEDRLGRVAQDGDIQSVIDCVNRRLEGGQTSPDPRELHYLAGALERLEVYDRAYALRSESHGRMQATVGARWDGQPIPNGNLAITPMRYDVQSLSYPIQYAALIGKAGDLAPGCKVYLPERLVPIFRRSFPRINARPDMELTNTSLSRDCHEAPLDRLPTLFAGSEAQIREAFRPLRADPDRVAELRRRYSRNGAPIVGISWGSTNSRKDVPGFTAWGRLLRDMPATIVSLQYGDTKESRRRIEQASGAAVLIDPEIDQLTNMDDFAAQLSAMDAIVSISGTSTHLAGALACPVHVLLDDRFHLTWPYFSSRTPWYPSVNLHRRSGRAWPDVMAEIARDLAHSLKRPAREPSA